MLSLMTFAYVNDTDVLYLKITACNLIGDWNVIQASPTETLKAEIFTGEANSYFTVKEQMGD